MESILSHPKVATSLLGFCLFFSTVEPCILEQIEHLWGPAVTKPMILLTKSSNMTLGRHIGLQHIQKSAS